MATSALCQHIVTFPCLLSISRGYGSNLIVPITSIMVSNWKVYQVVNVLHYFWMDSDNFHYLWKSYDDVLSICLHGNHYAKSCIYHWFLRKPWVLHISGHRTVKTDVLAVAIQWWVKGVNEEAQSYTARYVLWAAYSLQPLSYCLAKSLWDAWWTPFWELKSQFILSFLMKKPERKTVSLNVKMGRWCFISGKRKLHFI